jgi:hypothetical protein
MKLLPKVMIGLGAVVALAQLARPTMDNPPVAGDIQVPAEVAPLLKRACYDCHSNETKWPWYSNVAPVMWIVARDVEHGRKHLNFSVWESYEQGRKLKKLKEIAEEVEENEMPLGIYVTMHSEAKLTEAEKKTIVEWAEGVAGK